MSNQIMQDHGFDPLPCRAIPATRILIVDNDDVTRCLHETALSHAGYGTESANNGEDALILLATGDFDLVLTDCIMPVLCGADLVRALRRAGSCIPVMVVSGSISDRVQLPADIRDEVAVILPKPASLAELMSGIALTLRWFPAEEDTARAEEAAAFATTA